MARVLVCYGSKRGGTAEIAQWIAADLNAEGIDADVREAGTVHDLSRYDAVVVGGSVYAGRWHRHARRFVHRFVDDLGRLPVWLFSSGPLDKSAEGDAEPAITPGAKTSAELIAARGHRTFGGRLEADAKGFVAAKVAKNNSGDYRNRDQVSEWAREIARVLRSPEREPA